MADGDGVRKVAVVTGASRNIGRAIALGLAEDGADVVVHALSNRAGAEEVAEEVRRRGRRAITFLADVRDEAAIVELFGAARRQLGPVSILVNNAAIRPEARVEALSLAAWQEVLGIILDGAFLCAREALAQMREAGWGRVINIAGRTGQSGAPGRAHVVAGKAGLIGLTKALALECAAENITVNAVSPGSIDTPRHERSGHPSNRAQANIPAGRLGTSEEIASMVRYLASEQAAYVTGQTISVNGGLYL